MAAYRLVIKASAARDIDVIATPADRRRVVERVQQLAVDPRPPGCVELTGGDRYRVRQGRYRVVYEVRDQELVVVVVRVGDRRDVYRR